MKKALKRFLSLALACLLVFGCFTIMPIADTKVYSAYENTYTNTGNQRADIVGVALTQLGYTEGSNNDTKYGDWYGLPNNPWCAMFVSWCARQANIPTSILKNSAVAAPDAGYFNIPYYSGSSYTPQPGDLFFTTSFSHVGLVYYVDGDYFYTIEGNSNDSGSSEGVGVFSLRRKISSFYFGVPNYSGQSSHTVDPSYGTNFTAYPKATITAENIFDTNHRQISSTAWIGTSDLCTIHEVYTDGCCLVSYPLDSGGTNTVYSRISLFNASLNLPPVDLGTKFYANIINTKSGMYVTNDQNNITMRSENKNNNQKWCFEKQSDGSYSIISTLDSLCMDVDSSGQINGTNVKPYEYNENDAQLWYIIGSPSKYMLRPKCNNLVLDVSNNDSFEGTNVQMWEPNGTVAQLFNITISDPPNITVTLNPNGGNCSDVSISVTTGNQYGKLPVPSKRTNAFLGWSLSTSANDIITCETIVSTVSNHTLYAIWGDITCIRKIEYNRHEYCLYSGNVSWWDAKEFCEANGGYLATVTDANEQNIINSLNDEGAYLWLGASNIDLDGNWKWVTGESFDYTYWMEGEPNYSGNIEMFLGTFPYEWNDFAEVGDQIGGFVLETPMEYTVTFKDWDGTTLKTQTVNYGSAATAPPNPSRTGYTFTGWDKSFSSITADLVVNAVYEKTEESFFEFTETADTTNIVKSEVTTNLYFKAGGLSGSDMKALFKDADVTIVNANGVAVTDTATVGTGATITSTVNGVSQTLTVVVLGDVTGDGVVNGTDYAQILLSVKGKKQITDTTNLQAANVNGANADGSVSSSDINGTDYAQVLLMAKGRRASFNTQVK